MVCVNNRRTKSILSQAREAGYMSITDYQLAQRSEKDATKVKEDERAFAQSVVDMQKEAKEAGYGCREAEQAGWSWLEGYQAGYGCCSSGSARIGAARS